MSQLTIITGASRGLGLAMAHQLLEQSGQFVLCIARKPDASLVATGEGSEPLQWALDLSEPITAAARLEAWLHEQLPVRFADGATLINNAAVVSEPGPIEGLDAAELSTALRVSLEAPMLLCAAFLRATQDWTGPRKLLNISSGLGRRAMAGAAGYCTAKAGIDSFSRVVALDEAQKPNGAKIVSLAPGVIDTDMQVQLRGGDPGQFPDREMFVQLQAKGNLATPQAAAARVLAYLARADFGSNPVADVRDA